MFDSHSKAWPLLVPEDPSEPKWEDGDYWMDENEIEAFRKVFIPAFAKLTEQPPKDIDVVPLLAHLYGRDTSRYFVGCIDVRISGMSLTLWQKRQAAKVREDIYHDVIFNVIPEHVLPSGMMKIDREK